MTRLAELAVGERTAFGGLRLAGLFLHVEKQGRNTTRFNPLTGRGSRWRSSRS